MDLEILRWDDRGLLPVIVQDSQTNSVLTLAYTNREALMRTLASNETWLFSRSRNALWRKGEQSGNSQSVQSVRYDCDADALLYRVVPNGPACHTGAVTCFHNALEGDEGPANAFLESLSRLERILHARKHDAPADSYVAELFRGGVDAICKKIGEEAAEVIIAAKNCDERERIWEAADLLFHLLVLLEYQDIDLEKVGAELLRR